MYRPKADEGKVACSPHQWATMVLQSLHIPARFKTKEDEIWNISIKEHIFTSGSDLDFEDYLRLRVLWNTHTDQDTFSKYMRDNPALVNDKKERTPYRGYISPENDQIAQLIYEAIRPEWGGYLNDIQRVARGDATRPSMDCGMFLMARYWQGMSMAKVKAKYTLEDQIQHFRGKFRKRANFRFIQAPGATFRLIEAPGATFQLIEAPGQPSSSSRPQGQPSSSSRPQGQPSSSSNPQPPQTPKKPELPYRPQDGFGTPALKPAGPSAGGLQNPATVDETYVNTALLLLLQTVTRLMVNLQDNHPGVSQVSKSTQPTGNVTSKVDDTSSQPGNPSGSQAAPDKERTDQPGHRYVLRSANKDVTGGPAGQPDSRAVSKDRTSQPGSRPVSRPASKDRTSQPGSRSSSQTSRKGPAVDPLAQALSDLGGLGYLDWLADRLPLDLKDRSSTSTQPKKLMEARIDGYLCRHDFVPDSKKQLHTRFNKFPLAILEAKPFTRSSGLSGVRWQESAEIASWVSGLDPRYENVGLLRSSTSGRQRRLLISQDRHELWIIIAEYGDKWRQYIRGNQETTKPADFNQSQDVESLAGSEGYNSQSKNINRVDFDARMDKAKAFKKDPRSTATSRGPDIDVPGPDHFCIMHQFGPFKTDDASHMDFFMKRLIGLQIELLRNWPAGLFQYPERQ